MEVLKGLTLYDERALYGRRDTEVEDTVFDGRMEGESALKECRNIICRRCHFDMRYPLWHDVDVAVYGCEMTESCRAALWYSENIRIENSKLHGIKALRECRGAEVSASDIVSAEFGWMCEDVKLTNCRAKGEYFMFRSRNLSFDELLFEGKYSFQYVENATFNNCKFDTKDAFWHAKNVVVKNSVIKGEYLAWYCEDLTFENCVIIGTQPLCYCKGLKLINCKMLECDLAFERSEVEAVVTSSVDSIKNPYKGYISAPSVGEIILDDPNALCDIRIGEGL